MRILVFIVLVLAAPAFSEVKNFSKFRSWDIDIYSDENGRPNSCLGYASYIESGTVMLVGFRKRSDKEYFVLHIMNSSWKSIEEGKEYSIKIKFPNRSPWTIATNGLSNDDDFFGVSVENTLNDKAWEFISDYRKSLSMKVSVEGNNVGAFKLKGTSGMLSEAWKCFNSIVKPSQSDPFAPKSNASSSKKSDPFDI
ncbi:hypothetical protein N9381_10055 [Paracoccaceae bacterium]|jgi:hypothetical protein|nr:hypothetical protein [Paracoccaceae bacterium]